MRVARDHIPACRVAPVALACLGLLLIAGCSREDETALRGRLDQWFSLGDTVAFHATLDCAAGAFRLKDGRMKAAMAVTRGVQEMIFTLGQHDAVALDDQNQAPDAGMVAMANADRPMGMVMRRAALEGRACMNETTESAFRYALDNPRAVLAYDRHHGALMLLDPQTGVLIVAMGAE